MGEVDETRKVKTATLTSIVVPTPSGPVNRILGYDNPDDYLIDQFYVGSTGERAFVDNTKFDLRFQLSPKNAARVTTQCRGRKRARHLDPS
jgi:hypothetical protein